MVMEMLLARIVLAVAVSSSLCGIMLGTRALVCVAYPFVCKSLYIISWAMRQGRRLGGGHVSLISCDRTSEALQITVRHARS